MTSNFFDDAAESLGVTMFIVVMIGLSYLYLLICGVLVTFAFIGLHVCVLGLHIYRIIKPVYDLARLVIYHALELFNLIVRVAKLGLDFLIVIKERTRMWYYDDYWDYTFDAEAMHQKFREECLRADYEYELRRQRQRELDEERKRRASEAMAQRFAEEQIFRRQFQTRQPIRGLGAEFRARMDERARRQQYSGVYREQEQEQPRQQEYPRFYREQGQAFPSWQQFPRFPREQGQEQPRQHQQRRQANHSNAETTPRAESSNRQRSETEERQRRLQSYLNWHHVSTAVLSAPKTLSSIPEPQCPTCPRIECRERKSLQVCRHSYEALFRATENYAKTLKTEQLRWHPNRAHFHQTPEHLREGILAAANEMSQMIGSLLHEEEARR